MAKKKKGGKAKAKGGDAKAVEKRAVVPMEPPGWIKVQLKLVNWTFDNETIFVRPNSALHSIARRVKEKHGHVSDLALYKGQVTPANLLEDLNQTFDDLGLEGALRREDAKAVSIYYDFKPILDSSPLLLITPRTF
ncbi:Hypothetical Protein FCC1311_094632 [Hondaea fermentalgiana]|uniref:Uncharacterized protein n=1 Tax=Hondaea fermentalgiana TaxID=2315210 RepID=A0A2R5GSF4_9STRA|nr:Hypothetical Protein FCC1311_094632 [Hondaea fermentalgiana]|eukprot:GBG33239.1 Hypothetical Protein FCC1311_094632 [Hondaea fermentalgiana]